MKNEPPRRKRRQGKRNTGRCVEGEGRKAKLAIFMLALGIATNAEALEITVRGNISTQESEPVSSALVSLVNEADTTLRYSDTTDALGNYEISSIPLAVQGNSPLPVPLGLGQNFPNPSRHSTTIRYSVAQRKRISLKIYNILGQETSTLVDGVVDRGQYWIRWDGRSSRGKSVSSGVYFYVLRDGERAISRKMILLDSGRGGYSLIRLNARPNLYDGSISQSLAKAVSQTYSLKVSNTDSTEPRIIEYVQHSITISSDTTINVVVQRELNAPSINELADFAINEDEPGDSLVYSLAGKIHDDSPTSSLVIELYQTNPGLVNLSLDDSLRIIIDSLQADGNGYSDITVKVTDPDSLSAEEFFRLNVNAMDDFRGQHLDNYTETGTKAKISVDGVEHETDIEGLFDFQVSPEATHTITARTYDEADNVTGYRRTKTVDGNQDINDFVIYSVSYPTQDGVTPELFKAFCEEANFRMGGNTLTYTGLKTMLQNPNRQYWISSHRHDGATATAEEQAYVDSLISNEINPYWETSVPIYVEDPNNIEDIPYMQDGKIIVVPRASPSFGFASADEGQDGIIDYGVVFLPQGNWNESYRPHVFEELVSLLIGNNDVNNPELTSKTALRFGGEIFQIDEKLIKICENYQPKEQIDNILGL